MRSLRILLIIAIFIASIVSTAAFADGNRWVYDDLNISQIESCLNSTSYWISMTRKTSSDGTPYWVIVDQGSELKLLLFTFDEDKNNADEYESLMIVVRFNMKSSTPSLSKLNSWNQKYRYSTAYISKDLRTVISFELDLKGGVTKETIVKWMERAIRETRQFADYIGFT